MRNLTWALTLLAAAHTAFAVTTAPGIELKPGSATVDPDKTLQFAAVLSNAPAAKEIRYFVNSVRGGSATYGTITTAGLYDAPAVQPTAEGKVTVSAELWSTGNGAKKLASDTTVVTIRNTAKLNITPSYKDVGLGASFTFEKEVTGAPATLFVRWYVNNLPNGSAAVGTVTNAGVYKAPMSPPSNMKVTLRADLLAPSSGGSGTGGLAARVLSTDSSTIQLKNTTNLVLEPGNLTLAPGGKQQFTATVAGAPAGYRLRWSVTSIVGGNASVGTITTAGLYTAPASIPSSSPVVKVEVLPPGAVNTVLDTDTTTVAIKYAPLSITSASPGAVAPGAYTLVLRGSGFRSTTTATLDGTAVTPQYVSDSELRIPGNATTAELGSILAFKIANPSPNSSSAYAYLRVRSGGAPLLTSTEAHRFLRQATWGPRPQDLDHLMRVGKTAWLNEQFAMPSSTIPEELLSKSLEYTQEHYLKLALENNDQLRLRVAWTLHKIWVISGFDVESRQFVPYLRILLNRAFGNYFDLMKDVTLSPGMGEYLDMLNNKKGEAGAMPNENYAREINQLFTLGLYRLTPGGAVQTDTLGNQLLTYTQDDVIEFARVFTGWTYNDGKAGAPTQLQYYDKGGPMEAVQRYHDTGEKRLFNGAVLPPNQPAEMDLDAALRNIFEHPNLGPFVGKQLIQQLVTSNPSEAYVGRIAAVFANNGQGVRGDLKAVVRAILLDPEASLAAPNSGKLMEPALFVTNIVRGLKAPVTDTPFLADFTSDMGQRMFYPPSVFSYYSPGFRIAGGAQVAPEFQIYTSVTATARVNFAAQLLSGEFGGNVKVPWSNLSALARNPDMLMDYVNEVFLGSRMSPEMRTAILQAVLASSGDKEKAQTALYLTIASPQFQVER